MAKVFSCGEVIPGCTQRIVGATEQDVMSQEAAHARRAHGLGELPPDLQRRIAARIRDRAPDERASAAWAHVNIWRLSPADEAENTTTAAAVAEALRGQPGFRLYALVRTGEREVVAVTVFDSEDALEAALDAVAPVVRERISPLVSQGPERRSGRVLHLVVGQAA